jgi:hypothetical protein
VVDRRGVRWIVRHDGHAGPPAGWLHVMPAGLWLLHMLHRGMTPSLGVIRAECADGARHRVELGPNVSVADALDLVVAAIETDGPLPDRIDGDATDRRPD